MNELVFEENKLPLCWIRINLENCVEILDSRRIPINSSERQQRQGDIPYFGATDQVGWIDDYIFDEELVLLGEDGAPFFDYLKNKAYLINGKSWINNHAHVLKGITELLTNKFLCYYLNQIDYHKYVNGTTRLKLNQSSMKTIPIILPPLPEQKRIVTKIESIFSQIDAGQENLDKIKVLLKQNKQSVLKSAFEGKLVSQDPNDEPAEVLLKKIHVDSKIEFDKENLPKGWARTKLENICTIILGQSPPSSTYNSLGNGIPFFQGKSDFGDLYPKTRMYCSVPKKIAEKEDLLLSVRAPVGSTNLSLERCCIGRGLAAIRPIEQNMNIKWFIYFFRHVENHLESLGTGTTFKAISGKQIKELEIIIPPLNEQKRIVSKIESIFGRIDAIEKQVNDSLIKLDHLKKSVLKKAFEGKLVPQDPNDEPASVLLDKIKLEKSHVQKK